MTTPKEKLEKTPEMKAEDYRKHFTADCIGDNCTQCNSITHAYLAGYAAAKKVSEELVVALKLCATKKDVDRVRMIVEQALKKYEEK